MSENAGSVTPEHATSIVYLREFKPLSVAFPAPGIYRRVLLVLPPLEPSILSRLSPSGGEPLTLILDFGRHVSAHELLSLFKKELDLLKQIHSGAVSPLHRSVFLRLRLSLNRERMGVLGDVENPLDAVPELKNQGSTPRNPQKGTITRKKLSRPI